MKTSAISTRATFLLIKTESFPNLSLLHSCLGKVDRGVEKQVGNVQNTLEVFVELKMTLNSVQLPSVGVTGMTLYNLGFKLSLD